MNIQTILPPEPYEGTEPYLFISYSHKNSNQVWSVIDAMQARGFRIWYDKGIQVGTEYNNIIAEKLEGCTVLLSFNTDELFDSKYCMQELLYAANENKKIVNICFPLSQNPPRWYKLRFETTYQQIYRDRSATEEDFLDELCQAVILQDCRGLPKKQTLATSGEKQEKTHGNTLGADVNQMILDKLRQAFTVQKFREWMGIATPGLEYKKIYDNTLGADAYQLIGYEGDETEIIIPAKYEGLPVTRIGYPTERHGTVILVNSVFSDCEDLIRSITIPDSVTCIDEYAFSGCESLTSINIPNSVTSIGDHAFSGCESLTSINIPNSVTSIGDDAFEGCSNLTSIKIPTGVTSIGEYAFSECTGLTSIEIPNSVTSIGNHAFSECTGLMSIEIPNSVTSIGDGAFYDCTGLTSIEIPNSVTSIGDEAFVGCDSLTSITVDEGNTVYHSMYNCLIETATKTLIAGCKNSIIPIDGSVTSIGYGAFSECTGLTSIEIPNSVTSISGYAFSGCSSLTSITVDKANNVYHSMDNCIIETATKTLIAGCENSIIPIDGSVTSIGYGAFSECTGLTSITIPTGVTSIGRSAFYGCTGLTSIEIPNSVTSIGDGAFLYCGSQTSITFDGTKAEWNKISKGHTWDTYNSAYTIHCTDGDISK